MQFLINALAGCPEYKEMSDALRKKQAPLAMWGVPDSLKASFCYALCAEQKKKAIVIVPEEELQKTYLSLTAHFGKDVYIFGSREYLFRNIENTSHNEEMGRLSILTKMVLGKFNAIITSPEALMRFTLPKDDFKRLTLKIEKGKEKPLDEIVKLLSNAGYVRSEKVEGMGQFSLRGGILDFFAPYYENPVRIEFFGDEPDLIGEFDILSQRRMNDLNEAIITPVSEIASLNEKREEIISVLENKLKSYEHKKTHEKAVKVLKHDIEKLNEGLRLASIDKYIPILFKEKAGILDFADNAFVFAFELSRAREGAKSFMWRLEEDIKALTDEGVPFIDGGYSMDILELESKLERSGVIIFEALSRSEGKLRLKHLSSINAKQTAVWGGNIDVLADDLRAHIHRADKVIIAASNIKHAQYLSESLRDRGISATFAEKLPESLPNGAVLTVPFMFPNGYEIPSANFAVFSDFTAGFHKSKQIRKPSKHKKDSKIISSLSDLKPGDYIVHTDYGIGVYEGIYNSTINGVTKDQIKIRYMGSDVLYIPCSRLDLIAKYVGADAGAGLKLNKLGGTEWAKAKIKVKKAVKDLAKQLIALYVERMNVKGYAFSHDTEWQKEFEERFEYEETDDQLRCAKEIKKDMEKQLPMERLLCGDVGVGKTEVALRAAFKCVADDKQVAILVPTTVLAWQHFQTVSKRMAEYPVKIEMISRFRTPKEQENIIKRLKTGEIDIIIGTHRLLQKDIVYKNLGLAIIDEEQRFGVAHKERLKEIIKNVDVLTLSATPIPRTLNMALTGIRDLSIIEEPPHDRHPIQTYVAEFDYGIITDAIIKETARGGQCYYLHNRVETIYKTAAKLAEFTPHLRYGVAHGQMNEEELSEIWEALVNGDIDVLVCTTIIETGVDVSNVNTIIIEDADRLGLAQLHQIRGRVGRSARRAYAYLTYKQGKILTEDATKRLVAIREYTEFGSGLKIAMRDLEIRGAGNVLGAEQSGHLHSVGYDLYVSLLEEAVKEEKGEPVKTERCIIDLNISAFIPEKYITGSETRIDIYKKIAAIHSDEDASDVTDEIIDRFGEPPAEVIKLIKISSLKHLAIDADITEISQNSGNLMFYLANLDLEIVSKIAPLYKGRIMLSTNTRPYITLKIGNDDVLILLEKFLKDINLLLK